MTAATSRSMPRARRPGEAFLIAGLALVLVVALSATAVRAYAKATRVADHIVGVRHEAEEWLRVLLDAETAVRGYVASGEPIFLEPYATAVVAERKQAAAVLALIAADRAVAELGDLAGRDAQSTMGGLGEMVSLVRAGRRSAALEVLASGEGKRRMDRFRRDVRGIREGEGDLLARQRVIAASAAAWALFGSISLTVLAGVLIAFTWRRERLHGRLVDQLAQDARQRLRALSDLAGTLAEARTRSDVARRVVEHGMRAAGADTCTLYLLDASGAALELIADRGVAPEIIERIRRITETEGNPEVFKRMKEGLGTWAENEADYAAIFPGLATTPSAQPRAKAFWSTPLIAEGRALGLLGVGFYQPRRFPPDERMFVETLAGHCAQALLRAERSEGEDEARRWLATTLRSIGDAVIATDGQGRVTFMNPIAENLTGWSESDARGRPLDEVFCIFSEQTRAVVESPVSKVLREGAIVGLANHTLLRSRRGVEIPIDDSGAPIRTESGQIRGVVMVFRDVSRDKLERVRREFLAKAGEALVSSLDYQSTLATVARFAVPTLADWCAIDLLEPGAQASRQVAVAHVDESKVRFARELGERYPPNPDAPTGVPNVIRTGQSELYTEIPQELLERGARDADHLQIIRDLQLRSGMVVPLRAHGRIFGAMTFIYADSERRYSRDDLSFAEDFARRAAMAIENALALKETEEARTREQMLRSAAELANRAKDEFLATVSHELRTPLSAILGWAVLLRRRSLPEEIDRPLATIERNARLQTKLIEDVLDISRIISGKLVLNVASTKIADTVTAAVETVSPAAAVKGVEIETELPEPALTTMADPDRLQQVVWNLLSNAVKFTPKGGRVVVRAERRGSDVCIVVRDTGEGVRRAMLPFLFEPFRQADASTTRRHGGLGLGLAIVRQLVLAHGGRVEADSEGEGRGATFTVRIPELATIPAISAGTGASPPWALPPGQVRDDPPRLDGLRLLVVDDEADALELVSHVLREQGAEIHAASSARQALELLPEVKPDVLVSDVGMPEMDGLALMRAVRALPPERGGNTPSIALTAFARAEDVQRALAAGYQVHLSKPVEIGPLSSAVARLGRSSPPP
jgi:PAS domain S-box-containing protein